jgi:hypothetical protein
VTGLHAWIKWLSTPSPSLKTLKNGIHQPRKCCLGDLSLLIRPQLSFFVLLSDLPQPTEQEIEDYFAHSDL